MNVIERSEYSMYKILAVDDRKIFITELKRLKIWGDKFGFQIIDSASNGKEALELLTRKSYDVIFTDIRMPVIDGLQLIREVKKMGSCNCVVIFSEYSEFNYARQGIILGAFDYILKPPDEKTMIKLFERIKLFFNESNNYEKKYNQLFQDPINKNLDVIYPEFDEKQIIRSLINVDYNAVNLMQTTIENLYKVFKNNDNSIINSDILIKKLYHNVISSVYENFKWLNNYIDSDYFERMDYLNDRDTDTVIEFYCGKITKLLNFLKKLIIKSPDELIKNISNYILFNSDSDLKLKVISEKFYVNNTYLSNTFANKAGIRFNEYTTKIKMIRAHYLLVNTNMKTYEIGNKIGYHDINYFSKLFKKYYGQTPSEYRNMENYDYQI